MLRIFYGFDDDSRYTTVDKVEDDKERDAESKKLKLKDQNDEGIFIYSIY